MFYWISCPNSAIVNPMSWLCYKGCHMVLMKLASSTQCPTNVSLNQLSQQCYCQSHVPVVLYRMPHGPDELSQLNPCPTNVSLNQLSQQCNCQSHVPVVLYRMPHGPDEVGLLNPVVHQCFIESVVPSVPLSILCPGCVIKDATWA
jgi:hypothetical protein